MNPLDPYEYAQRRLRDLSKEFEWTPGVGQEWKEGLRRRLIDTIGLRPEKKALAPEILATKEHEGYRQETLTFQVREGFRVYAHLLIPDGAERRPAVIAIPGHGEGVDVLVGEKPADYQNQYALQCVRAGFVTLAIEPVSFGHRQSAIDADDKNSCYRDSALALMLGETMIGWRVQDAIAALDYLQTRPEVDPQRLATLGISGGGLVAFWTACLDERVKAAVVSGYFNTFLDSILSINHCIDNFAPGLAKVVEMPDMAALIAPRYLFVESGTEDPIFPREAFDRACARAREIFTDGRFESDLFEGGHEFSGKKAIPKLTEWLSLAH